MVRDLEDSFQGQPQKVCPIRDFIFPNRRIEIKHIVKILRISYKWNESMQNNSKMSERRNEEPNTSGIIASQLLIIWNCLNQVAVDET